MSISLLKIATSELKVGMFVSRLDRSWLETPYKVQGILIKDDKDIEKLMKYCQFVYIDSQKSQFDTTQNTASSTALGDEEQKELLIGAKPRAYTRQSEFNQELSVAHTQHEVLGDALMGAMKQAAQNNRLDLPTLQKAIFPMVDSVIRNPDAFSWLAMMKRRDNYAYNHAVSSSIWAAAFGRNLGLPIKSIRAAALGGLLFDIGTAKLPEKLIQNPNAYNAVEFNLVKKHVDYSIEIVQSIEGVDEAVIQMIATHHERHDGSGYPNGLKGDAIPLFGKMAGIIDCYDAMISDRPHAAAITPHEAVRKLYECSGKDFQPELIEQFIRIVGAYPVGSLVEISDGRVGVIVAHNPIRRLKPKVMIILNENKQKLKKFETINLLKESEEGNSLNIVKAVKPGVYGIDSSQFYF